MSDNHDLDVLSDDEEEALTPGPKPAKKRKRAGDETPGSKKAKTSESTSARRPVKKRSLQANDDGSDSDIEYEEDKYDENLYLDEEDRLALESMSELQREEILYQRGEERKQIQERNKIRRELKMKDKGPSAKSPKETKKKKTPAKGGDQKKRAALKDLAARRQDRTAPKRAHQYRAGEDEDDFDDLDEDDDEGYVDNLSGEDMEIDEPVVEPQTPRTAAPPKKLAADLSRKVPQTSMTPMDAPSSFASPVPISQSPAPYKELPPLALADIQCLQLTRQKLIAWMEEPFFHKSVKRLFVRCLITPGRNSMQSLYRFAEIYDSRDEGRIYKIDNVETNKVLTLQIGASKRDYKLDAISNQPITEEEFRTWRKVLQQAKMPGLTKKEIQERKKQIDAADNYQHTTEDIERMIEKNKAKLGNKTSVAKEKTDINIALQGDLGAKQQDQLRRRLAEIEAEEAEKAVVVEPSVRTDFETQTLRSKLVSVDKPFTTRLPGLGGTARDDTSEADRSVFERRRTATAGSWLDKLAKKPASAESSEEKADKPAESQSTTVPTSTPTPPPVSQSPKPKAPLSDPVLDIWGEIEKTPEAEPLANINVVSFAQPKTNGAPNRTKKLSDFLKAK